MIKLTILWSSSSGENSEIVYNSILSKIPLELFQHGNDIDEAVKKAAKAVDEEQKLKE